MKLFIMITPLTKKVMKAAYCRPIGLTDVIWLPSFLGGGDVWGVHRPSFVFQLSPSPMSQPSDLPTSQGLHLAQKSVNSILPNKNPTFTGK